jgi:flagellar basal body-associated protein FliL
MALITLKIVILLFLIAVAAFLLATFSKQSSVSVTGESTEATISKEVASEQERIFSNIESELG